MQRNRRIVGVTLFCCIGQFMTGQERSLKAEITPVQNVVKNDEIFSVATVIRNVGTKEESLTVWSCSYPAQWMTDNRDVHLVVVPCTRNGLELKRLKPGESFSRPLSLSIHLPSGQSNRARVSFRLGFVEGAYLGVQNPSLKVPLSWSNSITVTVSSPGTGS